MADVDDLGWRYSRHGYGPEDYAGRGVSHGAADAVTRWFGGDGTGQLRPQDHVRARDQRGRGPKGYQRRDERIREDIADWLTDDAWIDASDIEVAVERGEVTLSGTVDSREARRRAEDIAEAAAGVTYVQNNLRVRRADEGPTGRGGGAVSGDVARGSAATGTTATASSRLSAAASGDPAGRKES
jgi:hypothetical protein